MMTKQKTIIIIRHGESTWNYAKGRGDLTTLLASKDHALTSKGFRQAEELNMRYRTVVEAFDRGSTEVVSYPVNMANDPAEFARIRGEHYIKLYLGHVDKVYSSPFTRAIQTTILSMYGHPALAGGITLCRSIRENKTAGCFDATGKKTGPDIMPRVVRKFAQTIGKDKASELMSAVGNVDTSDVTTPWWLPTLSGNEKKDEVLARIREFMTLVRNCDAEVPVFVGHSQFFKSFYSTRVSDILVHNRPEFSEKLRHLRMGNATMMAITVEFIDVSDATTEVTIVDADFLFGGDFQSH